MKKLAIITTHPIQYNAPWYRLLTERNKIQLKVFYTWSQAAEGKKFDPGFGKEIEWDIPLLDGYDHVFVENTSNKPGTRSYKGIVNPGLIKAVKSYQPDAILVSGWNFKSHLQCLRHFHKKMPVLFRGDSTLLDDLGGWRSLLRKFILRQVYRYVDIALYVGKANQQYFIKAGLEDNQLVFAPHAIDNNRFGSAMEEGGIDFRRQLNIPTNELVFLFAGKLEPKKDPAVLVNAFRNLDRQGIHLIMAGNGVLENELKQQAGDQKNIHFIPFQNQSAMPALYAACDVFVLPSKGPGETWGLAINEAMAAGKPVVGTDRCGCADDLVINGETGFIVPAKNELNLKEKLEWFCDHPKQIPGMGKAATRVISDYSFEHIARSIEMIVLNKKGLQP